MKPRNRISFVVTFDKPEGVKVTQLRDDIEWAIAAGYPYANKPSEQWIVMTTLEVKRLRKPPSR